MTSACICKETLRKDTQVILKFRDSFFKICLHLINSNYTSYFLPSLMRSSGAGTSKEIPRNNNEVSLPAIPITFLFSFFNSSCSIKKLFNRIPYKSTCHPIFRLIRWIRMYSLWSRYPMNRARNVTTPRIF